MQKSAKEDLLAKVKEIDPKCKKPEEVVATQFNDEIYILEDTSVDKAFGEIVHEGKHALDHRNGLFDDITKLREETKLIVHDKYPMKSTVDKMTNKQVIELRARIAEREFQLAAKQKPDFQSVPEMISFIIR